MKSERIYVRSRPSRPTSEYVVVERQLGCLGVLWNMLAIFGAIVLFCISCGA